MNIMVFVSYRELIKALNIILLIQLIFFTIIYYATERLITTSASPRLSGIFGIREQFAVSPEEAVPIYDYYEYDAVLGNETDKSVIDRSTLKVPKITLNTPGSPKLLLFDPTLCSTVSGPQPTLLYIYSAPANIERRKFIRETYGNQSLFGCYNLRRVFVIGLTADYPGIPLSLFTEQRRYNDLLVGDFIETYRNLSWKGLTMLNFISQWCNEARFLIKTDDDVMLDLRWVLETLSQDYKDRRRFMLGKVQHSVVPRRCQPKHRWCVSKLVYPRNRYPPYCLGQGIVFSADLVPDLYRASFKLPLHPVDDIYTGLLLENLQNTTLEDLGSPFLEPSHNMSMYRLRLGDTVRVMHMAGHQEMMFGWKTVQSRYSDDTCPETSVGY